MSTAACCGIRVAEHKLLCVANRNVYLSKRFDRQGELRKHFLSAYTIIVCRWLLNWMSKQRLQQTRERFFAEQ